MRKIILLSSLVILLTGCKGYSNDTVLPGAFQTQNYIPLLKGKRVAVVANQTSLVANVHLVDTLLSLGINVVKVFGPEHGFRGNAGAGEAVDDAKDLSTGIPVVSLYGKHKKPAGSDLKNVDIVVFDIQDVGVRFYTYISTLALVMEACAGNDVPVVILDRPSPHAGYIDGPVLEPEYASFVGMFRIPVVYGMTIGEYAKMVNGEGWLEKGLKCQLTVIPVKNYTHSTYYELPVKPSPNLPDMKAVELYPSLCFFEGTIVSVGRGTNFPFKVIGHPAFSKGSFSFVPESIPGVAPHPKYEGNKCYGYDLSSYADTVRSEKRLDLRWLIEMYRFFKNRDTVFFNPFFDKLAGTDKLRKQIEAGFNEREIRESWKEDLKSFEIIRGKYLLYSR